MQLLYAVELTEFRYKLLYRDVYDSKRKLTMQLTFSYDNSHQENFLSAFCIVLNMSIYDTDFHVGLCRVRKLQKWIHFQDYQVSKIVDIISKLINSIGQAIY